MTTIRRFVGKKAIYETPVPEDSRVLDLWSVSGLQQQEVYLDYAVVLHACVEQ